MEYIYTLPEFPDIVKEVLGHMRERQLNLVLLEGDLGAGKTTFTQLLAKELGITESLISPTFVLMKKYDTPDALYTKLVHIDAYRIDDGSLYKILNLETLLSDEACCFCIEWPERIEELASFPHCRVQLTHIDISTRKIVVTFNHNKK